MSFNSRSTDRETVPVEKKALITILRSCSSNVAESAAIYTAHYGRLSSPINSGILKDTKGINPKIFYAYSSTNDDCILERFRQVFELDASPETVFRSLGKPQEYRISPTVTQSSIWLSNTLFCTDTKSNLVSSRLTDVKESCRKKFLISMSVASFMLCSTLMHPFASSVER